MNDWLYFSAILSLSAINVCAWILKRLNAPKITAYVVLLGFPFVFCVIMPLFGIGTPNWLANYLHALVFGFTCSLTSMAVYKKTKVKNEF